MNHFCIGKGIILKSIFSNKTGRIAMRNSILIFLSGVIFSCNSPRSLVNNSGDANEVPECLRKIIKTMSEDLYEGIPQSITQFNYRGQKVYYLVAPCCDKFNIVYDSACSILGYPDGGITGRGDGKMVSFEKEATDGKLIWEASNEMNKSTSTKKN